VEVIYHPLAKRDILDILRYYRAISRKLEEEFHHELRGILAKVTRNPLGFHSIGNGFRRANLQRFPYHVLYDFRADEICIMVVRHNKRRPEFGLERT
jgi:toxin ParE1/3/4